MKLLVGFVMLSCFAPSSFAARHDVAERMHLLFRHVPRQMNDYVEDMQDLVKNASDDAEGFQGALSRREIWHGLQGISHMLPHLRLGIGALEDLPEEIQERAERYPYSWFLYNGSDRTYYVIADRIASRVKSPHVALRAVFTELFAIKTTESSAPSRERKEIALLLCSSQEYNVARLRQQRDAGNVHYVSAPTSTPHHHQHQAVVSTPAYTPPPQRPQMQLALNTSQPSWQTPVNIATLNTPAPVTSYTPAPSNSSSVANAFTDVRVASLQGELDRTRLQNEIDKANMQRELYQARDDRHHLEERFQAWLAREEQRCIDSGKAEDVRRAQRDGRHHVSYAPYTAPGGWGTTNAYGAGGATIYYSSVCGDWLNLPAEFAVLKPR